MPNSQTLYKNHGYKNHWSSLREAGTLFGMRLLFSLYRFCGRWLFSLLMYPVVGYFIVCRPAARRASLEYLTRLHHYAPNCFSSRPTLWHVWTHFRTFAEAILDKLLAWFAGIDDDLFDIQDQSAVDTLMADSRGQLIFGTHFGNLEFCRGFIHRYREKIINILIYDQHALNFAQMRRDVNEGSRINIFQVDEFNVPTILELQQKISQGEWVFIATDRIPLDGLERTIDVEFMGKKAPLPMGPYLLAEALSCPVKLMFGYRDFKKNNGRFIFEVIPFAEKIDFKRSDREQAIRDYAQEFSNCLEARCLRSPYQWFNFFSFWHRIQD